jgi:predicted HicB family RNase H-like nuclease
MKKQKKLPPETITIRPTKEYKGISEKINILAKRDKRSLNNYVLILFENHLKEQNAL